MSDREELIKELRSRAVGRVKRGNTSLAETLNKAADYIEAAERDVVQLNQELAAAQSTIAEAVRQTRRGNVATPPWVIEALAQPLAYALASAKAEAWEECSREWVARQVVAEAVISQAARCVREEYPRAEALSVLGNPLPPRPVNPYRTTTEGEKR